MDYLTTKECAAIAKVARVTIIQNIRRKHLYAVKFGRDWLVKKSDMQSWMDSNRPSGRPKRVNDKI